ncbi:hypothetical protein CDL12_05889 [Handroanthus impetiginosus]|uniref:Uncharacterized protein n=1 Tax=Handroanthus impetiginosus TaxID=429701 RepID=A0A2G9HV68_9LAMI|nr:hypothetical protein CDL12_05889 [Handroanthus impetiginosus]
MLQFSVNIYNLHTLKKRKEKKRKSIKRVKFQELKPQIHLKNLQKFKQAGISIRIGTSLLKITVKFILPQDLIILIHGVCSVGPNRVRVKARPAFLNRAAIKSQTTHISRFLWNSSARAPRLGRHQFHRVSGLAFKPD